MKSALDILSAAFDGTGVDGLLIGGYALEAYGVMRQTLDVDCLVGEPDLSPLHDRLLEAGYEVSDETALFRRYRHESISLMDIDVLLVDAGTTCAGPAASDRP